MSESALASPNGRPPGPAGLPLLGSLLSFRSDILGFLLENTKYGDVAFYHIGGHPVFQANHPDVVDAVLLGAHQSMFKDEVTSRLSSLLGNGLVTSEGDFWRRHRKLAAPAFGRKQIDGYGETMVACARHYVDTLKDGDRRDIHADMMGLTHEIVLRTLLGTENVAADEAGVGAGIEIYMEEFQYESQGWRRLLPAWVPTWGRRRMKNAVRAIDAVVYQVIEERRRTPGDRNDVLSRLLAARDDDGNGLTDQQLRDEAVTFFVAGHETTALALTYTWDLLAKHPDALKRLHAEVDAFAGRALTSADYPALTWTTAVVQEAMRVHPPVWTVGRLAIEDVEIAGYKVKKGDQFLLPQWVLHRDARWFPDPESFTPARWLDGLAQRLPRSVYFPFGGGPRVCIGNHFAMLEAVLLLATIAQRVDLAEVPGPPMRFLPSVTLRPVGAVPMTVSRRRTPGES